MPSFVVASGVPHLVDFDVRHWDDTKLHFMGRMRTETRAVVAHWTAAENPPEKVYANMKAAGLSVHFCVASDGTVFQFADASIRAAHAKAHNANSWSVGIEFVCRGSNMKVALKKAIRPRAIDYLHGKLTSYDDLTAAQTAVGARLVGKLCRIYDLPIAVPEDRRGEVVSTELPAADIAKFRGVLGHLNLEEMKPDPGVRFLRVVQRVGLAVG